ncbi:MAG: nucleoside kinase [Nocardioidaceae bacterium]|nr:nucleoside kinase [Nocardioidaceae bacterium]
MNFLVEGVSGTGKTSVCHELRRRGFDAINGDTDLAYQGDPVTGEPVDAPASHWHHIWSIEAVRERASDLSRPVTFFCGGSRNAPRFAALFDAIFVLEIDLDTLNHRLDERGVDEFGSQGAERELVLRLHQTGEDTPTGGIAIDATRPLAEVVDDITRRAENWNGH